MEVGFQESTHQHWCQQGAERLPKWHLPVIPTRGWSLEFHASQVYDVRVASGSSLLMALHWFPGQVSLWSVCWLFKGCLFSLC